jgi:polysaccharide pyruvyl transferase WcaK-like protein
MFGEHNSMSFPGPQRKIGVFSHGGTKNLGDEALLAAVIQNVRLRLPDAEVIGFTINPADTRQRHGIACFPIRRLEKDSAPIPAASLGGALTALPETPAHPSFASRLKNAVKAIPGLGSLLPRLRSFADGMVTILAEPKFLLDSYRRLKGVELLLVAGSQQLNDGYGGPWGFPFTLLRWTLIAKCTGTKVAILSVGAGPIHSPLSKFFFKRVLGMVDYRSYRDAISSRLMESMGVSGSHPVYPDLVYSLTLPAPNSAQKPAGRVVVGTNPVPFFDGRYWPTSDPTQYQDYVRKFARFAEWLDQSGHSVLFFPTQVRADVLTIADIRQAMNGSGDSPNLLAGRPIQTLSDLVSEISRADFVVANRYHGILISLMMNKPVLAVAYHEKSRALLAQAGQGDYVLNIGQFKTEELIERFSALEANAAVIKKQIAERLAPLRRALDEQYDTVFKLIGVKSSETAQAS